MEFFVFGMGTHENERMIELILTALHPQIKFVNKADSFDSGDQQTRLRSPPSHPYKKMTPFSGVFLFVFYYPSIA